MLSETVLSIALCLKLFCPKPSFVFQCNLLLVVRQNLSKLSYHILMCFNFAVLDKPDVEESSFEWLQCLKYQIDISHDKRRRIYDRHREGKLIYGNDIILCFNTKVRVLS